MSCLSATSSEIAKYTFIYICIHTAVSYRQLAIFHCLAQLQIQSHATQAVAMELLAVGARSKATLTHGMSSLPPTWSTLDESLADIMISIHSGMSSLCTVNITCRLSQHSSFHCLFFGRLCNYNVCLLVSVIKIVM